MPDQARPPKRPFLITTSWDDGHPCDLRVAELLARYGLSGTFYVPNRNSEGRSVLSACDVRFLGEQFEIGSHGRDHIVLTGLRPADLRAQIVDNKAWLEDTLGRDIRGFCYVRGRHDDAVVGAVRSSGFRYARTVQNFRCGPPRDPFLVPTTMQFFPHPKGVYLRNLLRHRAGDPNIIMALLGSRDLVSEVSATLDAAQRQGGHFHLWGHSWEIEDRQLWCALEEAFEIMGRALGRGGRAATNGEVVSDSAVN